ncbi:hypothetical protein [Paenibacillus wynnii]|nr:hypothetical protein [Paenibacillus wynnii]
MKKMFMLMVVVITLVGINSSVVSAYSKTPGADTRIVLLNHGVDH